MIVVCRRETDFLVVSVSQDDRHRFRCFDSNDRLVVGNFLRKTFVRIKLHEQTELRKPLVVRLGSRTDEIFVGNRRKNLQFRRKRGQRTRRFDAFDGPDTDIIVRPLHSEFVVFVCLTGPNSRAVIAARRTVSNFRVTAVDTVIVIQLEPKHRINRDTF